MPKSPDEINEQMLAEKAENAAKYYFKKYRAQMESLDKSPVARLRSLTAFDYAALGKQLEQFENYKAWANEEGTASDLGRLPQIALDVITASYGTSIIPIIASSQPIEEERGIIYFKQVRAVNTRGNVNAGDILQNPLLAAPGSLKFPQGYAGEKVTQSLPGTILNATGVTGTLTSLPVRPNSFSGTVPALGWKFQDDGAGNLLGIGMFGTINYATGAYVIDFISSPDAGTVIQVAYGTNFEESGNVPKITTVLASDSIDAEIFALASELGLFKSYAMKKRFGKSAEDEMTDDLTNEMTAEIGNTALARLNAVTMGTRTWYRRPGAGVSYFEHKQELKDQISFAESTILTNAGRGVANVLIAGPEAAAVLSTLPGFEKVTVSAAGPQLYGTLDGMTVIRAAGNVGPATNEIIVLFKGNGAFDAPIVYSTFMPLFITNALQTPGNILKKTGVAAVWAGLKVVVPAFATRLVIQDAVQP